MKNTMKRILQGALLVATAVLYSNCAKNDTSGIQWQSWNNLPFQVQDSIPSYLAVNVPKGTSEIQVIFTEPANVSSILNLNPPNNVRAFTLKEISGSSTIDISNRVIGVSSPDGGRTVTFQISADSNGNYLKYAAGYELTLYPSITSASTGAYMQYLTKVAFSTGPTDNFGFGEIIKEGPPSVLGDIQRDLYCGCMVVYARFTESLAQAPVFYIKNKNLWGFLGLVNGSAQQVPTYPVFTNRTDTWGVSLGCSPVNQAWDREVEVTVIAASVYDLEGEQMTNDKKKTFNNSAFYSCP